ncbi:unnamed protein product (macronuclear) [Paramecium tetraurelia]|uniref:EGF-like domain-containing protein n=1 Tax=Paramecium tetraurelia TaxID=5888 RepID=A0CEB1_PARTE|nr:uncharacterized protein GSPATT00037564001 [Paramecium tetraurelia]CAK69128.1 unnamed protein product [Paramecium tetraurelia]|eukprot:XP_001436525.1 hypothetical protein (macronuclear) [Paramecium tetraurelia strain d4-2]
MKVETFLYILLILGYFGVNGLTNQPAGVQATAQTDSQPAYLCSTGNNEEYTIGYFFNDQICMSCLTVAGGLCTCKAYNGCDTLTCNDVYLNIILCRSCITIPDTNCAKGGLSADGTSIVCYSCKAGSSTTLIGGICVSNNNCQTFDLNTGICTKCNDGFYNVMAEYTPSEYFDTTASTWTSSNYPLYFQNIQQCKACNADVSCKTCNFLTQCTACIDNFYLSGTKCNACITGCQKCNDSSTCTTCISTSSPPYYLTNTNTCIQCSGIQYWDTQQKKCVDCTTIDPNCTACTSNTCTTCSAGNYPVNGTCKTCTGYPTTCSACDANGTCTSCTSNSVMSILVQQNNTCKTCPTNCYSASNCQFNSQNNTTICTLCQDLYYVNASGQCALCDSAGESNALRCHYDATVTGNIVYTQCKSPYFLANNKCTQAQSTNTCAKLQVIDSQTQLSNQNCAECWPGYIQSGATCFQCNNCQSGSCSLNTSNQPSCTLCVDGYYADTNQNCQSCISNCTSCSGSGIGDCTNCQAGYFKGTTSCTACTVDSNNHATCLVCQDATNCSSCINGYYVSNGLCLACQYGCSQCTTPGNVCTACINGYYLQNGGCVQDNGNCYSTDKQNVLTTIQANQTNGCQICNYGFYLTSGWLTQQTSSQIQDYVCMQCVYPQTAFVCRTNPQDVSVQSVQPTVTSLTPSSQYFAKGSVVTTISNFGLLDTRYTQATCAPGYFWTNQSCMPCMSVTNGTCTSCTNLTACTQITCSTNYFLTTINNTQLCAPIPAGCSELTYSTTLLALACTKCNTGYTLVGSSICVSNTGCQTVNPSTGICTQCSDGFYFNWDFVLNAQQNPPTTNTKYYSTFNQFCSACQAGCQTCPSQYTCTLCLPGYFWYQSTVTSNTGAFIKYSSNLTSNISGQCVTCPKYCQTCTSATTCSTCYPNFQPDPNSTVGACMCPSGYNLITSGSSITCIQQTQTTAICNITACSQCNADNTQCLACLAQYQGKSYTLMGSTCVTCTQNCSSCTLMTGSTSQTTCQVCQNGYYKTQSANDQPVLCSICSQTGALLCQGPLENATFSQVTVIQCQNNYYLYNGTCVPVPTTATCYTISAQNGSNCQQCLPGYTLFGSTCQTCATSKNQNCVQCNANADQTGLQCTQCQNGYVIDSTNNVCVACISGCTKCTLIAATQNTAQSTLCSACNDGNYLDNTTGRCFACPYDCKTCDTKFTCTTCKDGFYLKQSQTTFNAKQYTFKPCYPCQSNCATCSANGNVCLTCSSGYVLQNGGCVNLQQSIVNDANQVQLCQLLLT